MRRAISAAYYAFFHLLTAESTFFVVGGSSTSLSLRQALVRAFQHRQMKEVCKWFARGTGFLPDYIKSLPQARVVPPELQSMAQTFIDLQEMRHLADYSLAATFVRADALRAVTMADAVFLDWSRIRRHGAARLFLLLLLAGDGLRPRA
ncbi:MAG: hypothetical protein HYY24_02640 [Verrucomicrobia bacterium]|nr:hypothetical protein [Verrucomicrobiota bacterium]